VELFGIVMNFLSTSVPKVLDTQIPLMKTLLPKILDALCVSVTPLSPSPQTKMVGRAGLYMEKMVFPSLLLL
jgi:hypothetical protein